MERKIGEIFECNGEWYQCVEGYSCGKCSLRTTECGSGIKSDLADEVFGECSKIRRSNNKHVIFKKLEKVGEPFKRNGYLYQEYKAHTYPLLMNGEAKLPTVNGFAVKIKQNKEDMEEKKPNMKPFDLEAAKASKPVCTRDGRKARIICFDAKDDNYPLVVAVMNDKGKEDIIMYTSDGHFYKNPPKDDEYDLLMLPEKKEGWVNVYRDCDGANITRDDNIYSSKEAAIASAQIIDGNNYVATTKINWEE